MKRLVPLLAVVPVAASYTISGKFAFPTGLLIVLFALLLGFHAKSEHPGSILGLGLFWLGPLATVWALSERREGREIWNLTLPLGLAVGAVGTMLLLRRTIPRNQIWLILAAILTWCVSYFGGSGGGADHMRSYYSFLGLSPEATWTLIVWSRKIIHVTFYSLLATCFYNFLASERPKPYLEALSFAFSMAVCDEWRQNMMPNREGSIRDVILDIGAASIWLWWRYLRTNSTNPTALGSEHQT
jgi:VanZ family protein